MMKVRITAAYCTSTESGYIAYIEELPHIFSQGDTIEDARRHLLAAMELWLASNRQDTRGTFGRPVVRRETIAHVTPAPIKG